MSAVADDIWAILRELAHSQKETDLKFQETDRLIKELFISQKDTDARMKDTDARMKDTDVRMKDTDAKMKYTDAKIRELGKQIGGLGEKFGSFTEGLALPSMEKILQQRFGMEVISPSVRVSKGGQHLEIDVLAYANSAINRVYLVEVKSHPREESIAQIKSLLARFRDYFPEHKDKAVFGILAAVDLSADIRERALHEGLYVARIHDNVFELDTPDEFQPRAW